MTDVMNEIMSEGNALPSNNELDEINTLAEEQLRLERQIETMELSLSEVKEKFRNISENLLPEAMAACGMKEFTMQNGLKIRVKEDIHSSIRKDFLAQAVTWLDQNNLGGIVKHDVAINFGRGDAIKAHQLVQYCEAQGYPVTDKESVHPMTLKATVKEQMAKGVQFPDEFFSIYPSRKTEIKLK